MARLTLLDATVVFQDNERAELMRFHQQLQSLCFLGHFATFAQQDGSVRVEIETHSIAPDCRERFFEVLASVTKQPAVQNGGW